MRKHSSRVIVLIPLLTTAFAPYAFAQASPQTASNAPRRVALVIGNGAYPGSPLKNPPNDAKAIGKALEAAGFSVTVRTDRSREDFWRDVTSFSDELQLGGGVGLFFYAGHGVQVEGRNYLIPVDATIALERDVKYQSIDVNDILEEMRNTPLKLMILDACRDNPYSRSFRSQVRGLAEIKGSIGTLIAYATEPGGTAADGDTENSVYTSALLGHISAKSVSLSDVLIRVRRRVLDVTGGKQIPWEAGALLENFYFHPSDKRDVVEDGGSSIVNPPTATTKFDAEDNRAHAGVIAALGAYRSAYESMDVEALRRVYPSFKNFEGLRRSFADLVSVGVAMNPASAVIATRKDGAVIATSVYSMTFTPRTGKIESTRPTRAEFQLRRAQGSWIIEGITYK